MKPLKRFKKTSSTDGTTEAAQPIHIKYPKEKDAIDFVTSYYNSPGFLYRFYNIPSKVLPKYYTDDNIRAVQPNSKIWVERGPLAFRRLFRDESLYNNALYDNSNAVVMGPIDFSNKNEAYLQGDYGDGYDDVLAHELGHAIDNSIMGQNIYKSEGIEELGIPDKYHKYDLPSLHYSDLFPVFRNGGAYKKALNILGKTNGGLFEKYPSEIGGDELHDARPSESYADLIKFRYQLYKNGIYDSRKIGLPFRQKHLDQFRRINKSPQRLLKNYSDEDIIWMMNNVASNQKIINTSKPDEVSYVV